MKKNKFGNKRVKYFGYNFDSMAERNRYRELILLEKSGHIADLKLQHEFLLQEEFKDSEGNKHKKIVYKADFFYFDFGSNMFVIEDVKGYRTQVYRLKKKILLRRLLDMFPSNASRKITFMEINS